MKLLTAFNSFKGTISSVQANKICASVLSKNFPGAEIIEIAAADGGDGFLDCFSQMPGARKISLETQGPAAGMTVKASFVMREDEVFIEIAEACGIKHLKGMPLRPLDASTFGLAAMVKAAIRRKAKKIYFGLGGTASSDGGLGLACGLGFNFLDKDGNKIDNSIHGLLKLKKILPPENPVFKKIEFFAVSDVSNPLLGAQGTARVYSPQKGASPKQVRLIEKALENLALRIKEDLKKDVSEVKGGGAAGGLGAGLAAFWDAKIEKGAEFIAGKIKLESFIASSDAVFTGEGIWDRTDFYGKMPHHIAMLAREKGKKVFCICFENKTSSIRPFDAVIEIKSFCGRDFSIKNPRAAFEKAILAEIENIRQKLSKNSKMSL